MNPHDYMLGVVKRALAVEPAPVVVEVVGGIVVAVKGLPEGVRCEVHDYDTEGADPSEVRYDENEDAFLSFDMEI